MKLIQVQGATFTVSQNKLLPHDVLEEDMIKVGGFPFDIGNASKV